MPNVGGKKFPYTKQGMKDAEEAKNKMGYKEGGKVKKKKKDDKKKLNKKMMTDGGGSITGKMDSNRKKVLDEIKANNSKPTPSMQTAPNNTMPPKPQAPAAPAAPAGAAMGGAAGGMGMPPKKPPMPGMKKGGKVKKGGSCGGYKKGGKVRGAGSARQGVKKCKMR